MKVGDLVTFLYWLQPPSKRALGLVLSINKDRTMLSGHVEVSWLTGIWQGKIKCHMATDLKVINSLGETL
tara:strand:- start:174 stop:383 length:210 start_codon:yes stop_codon:yes gene_type:complete